MTESWIKPINRKSLSREVMESIKDRIVSGDIKPGEYLPSENELTEKFNVGKSSVREAIKMLEALGYIEICKGNGCRVRTELDSSFINPLIFQLVLEQSKESRGQILEFRQTVEIASSNLAIDKADSSDIQAIQDNIDRTIEDYKKGKSTLEDDMEFHRLIFSATHNEYLIIIGKAIMELFKPSLVRSNKEYPEKVIDDHRTIFEALKNKDKKKIENAIKDSLSRWYILSIEDT